MRLPYALAGRAATLAASFAPPGGGKLRRSLAARRGAIERLARWARVARDPRRPLIWMHAPSVGEGLMARPVIEILRRDVTDAQIAYTFFSPSAEAFARTLDVDIADYLPFDTEKAARAMLDGLAPSALVFSKLDVWPILAGESARRGVPLALTSATLDESSSRRSWLARALLHDAYASLAAVGAVHDDDATRLVTLGVRSDRITVTGDVRYDQVWTRAHAPSPNAELLARLRSDRPTVVAGSTWPADEAPLFAAWADVIARAPGTRLIVAAHEPSDRHTSRVAAWASGTGLTYAHIDDADARADVVVVDRIGVLADLYSLATAAFVGGGFHGRGLHSVVEPAAHGVPVVFGPRATESRDARSLMDAAGGFVAGTSRELADRLATLLTVSDERAHAGDRARTVIAAGLGAAERSATLVRQLLAGPR